MGLEKGLGLEKNDLEICLGLEKESLNNVSNLKYVLGLKERA
jgi:hypothetical protein